MIYAKVENGQVIVELPLTGIINNSPVSNYNLLPASVLLQEGWLPYEENIPEYDAETQDIRLLDYTINVNNITGNYEVIEKVIVQTVEERLATVETENEMQDNTIGEILENIIPMMMEG